MTREEIQTDNTETLKNALERIEELEKEAEELIQRFEMANSMNCFMQLTPDRKQIGEMLVMIAEPREKRIAELEKEKCELLGIIQGKDKVIAELKERFNIRSCQNCKHNNKSCPNDGSCNHYSKWESYKNPQLVEAKDLLKWFVWYFREGSPNLVPYKHKVAEADQFLKEI